MSSGGGGPPGSMERASMGSIYDPRNPAHHSPNSSSYPTHPNSIGGNPYGGSYAGSMGGTPTGPGVLTPTGVPSESQMKRDKDAVYG